MLNLKKSELLDIDLKNTQGNAFYMIEQAKILSKKYNKDSKTIIRDMTASNFENLLRVFKREFGDHINIIE
jgi:hypothetical protein